MRVKSTSAQAGFAIIITMIVIAALGILAGSFAFAMKVETRLAGNASNEAELEWLGRSGVELGRYVLGQSMRQPYTSLNQIWAGGPGSGPETNGPLVGIELTNVELGEGRISVRMFDMESRLNLNLSLPDAEKKLVLNRALTTIIGVDPGDAATIEDSILDWMDADDASHLAGTESDFYLGLPQAYFAKNGPIDDLAELLLVRGVTPEVYWGPRAAAHRTQWQSVHAASDPRVAFPAFPVGLVDLFCALSAGRININTASPFVLQLLPGVDENVAQNIVRARAGPDGVERTEDDTPFATVGALNPANVPGIIPELASRYPMLCDVRSSTFEVQVTAELGRTRRTYTAVVRRNSPTDLPILQFGWK